MLEFWVLEIKKIHKDSISELEQIINFLDKRPFISYGDTPSCSVIDNFPEVLESNA